MKVDNKITVSRLKRVLTVKTVSIVLLAVILLTAAFYCVRERQSRAELHIWYITDTTENCFADDAIKRINDYGQENGFRKIVLTRRHPEDAYLDVVFSTAGFYSCDMFIMDAETAEKYGKMEMYMPLDSESVGEEKLLYIDGRAVGYFLDENFYFLVNAKTKADFQVIFHIYNILCGAK